MERVVQLDMGGTDVCLKCRKVIFSNPLGGSVGAQAGNPLKMKSCSLCVEGSDGERLAGTDMIGPNWALT